tara:strand:+ start:828 stop:1544 length:717 start_codon:yes stop_codon:yes gene_type:complete
MIKTKYSSIVSHKYNNQYICYDSSVQPILERRILSCLSTDEFRLNNNSNFLDYNNGFIKKHFWRKGGMSILKDSYLFLGLSSTRPIRELINYIDFTHILNNLSDTRIKSTFELCLPVFCYIKREGMFYKGDIILSKIEGITLDKYISSSNIEAMFYRDLSFCFNTLFENGIFNFDMNLKNIIFNTKTKKISFIDFDKLLINPSKKDDEKMSLAVLRKFKRSLSKFNLDNKFDWEEFTK